LPYPSAGLRESDKEDGEDDDDEDEEDDAEVIGDIPEGQAASPTVISAETPPIVTISAPDESALVLTEDPPAPTTDADPSASTAAEDPPVPVANEDLP
jgi:hypothetical protein